MYTIALHPYGNVWDRMRLALGHLRTGISISEGALSLLKRSGRENNSGFHSRSTWEIGAGERQRFAVRSGRRYSFSHPGSPVF